LFHAGDPPGVVRETCLLYPLGVRELKFSENSGMPPLTVNDLAL
jgi:hypothetical protein